MRFRNSYLYRAVFALLFAVFATGLLLPAVAQEPPIEQGPDPSLDYLFIGEKKPTAEVLESRGKAQIAEAKRVLEVFHDFGFQDKYVESGITFRHQPTDDGIKRYTMVHYDHGNGILVADVDNDGRYDIYLISQFGGNELWRNLGSGKFENITQRAGIAMADRISVTGSFTDVDNDGDADLYMTTVRMGNVLFENDGTGRFRDITQQAGLGHVAHSSAGVFFDYDRDGLLDLFLANVGVYTLDERGKEGYYIGVDDAFAGHLKPERFERSILYRNTGGNRFVDVSEKVGLVDTGWTGDVTPIDVNADGYLDLYVLNMQGDDHFYVNVEGKQFIDKTAEYFPKSPWGAMGVKVFDYDNNGLMDLMLTDMHSDMSEDIGPEREKLKSRIQWGETMLLGGDNNIFGNALWQQYEPGKFREVSDKMGTENYWPWGVSVADVNADGWQDVFVAASMCYPYRYGVNSMLLNNRGKKFIDTEFLLGIEPRVHGFILKPWFPLDCAGADTDHRHCQEYKIKGRYLVWGALGTRTSVVFDLDEDGDLDIVTGDFHAQPQVLISNLAAQREIHFLKVRLEGSESNRDGLGARVTVVAGPNQYTKIHDGKSGYLSQSRMPLYFGLGDASAVDRVEVVWPSGNRQVVDDPGPINRILEIKEKTTSSATRDRDGDERISKVRAADRK